MKTPPSDLGANEIIAALAHGWGRHAAVLDYVPLGFGSHHWIAAEGNGDRWFVTVDDLRAPHLATKEDDGFGRLRAAFGTATALRHSAGLSFVVAPIAGRDCEVLRRLGEPYAITVFPYLDVAPTEYGEFRDQADRAEALRLIGTVHNATGRLATAGLRRDTLAIPREAALWDALDHLDAPWESGPYSEPARSLLRDKAAALRVRLRRFAALRARVDADQSRWVITHGETHASNVIRTRAGELVMVDWDTVALAPRERDLWNLVDERAPDWSPYAEVTGVTSLSMAAMKAYRLHWDLSEIAIYVEWCRAPHERTEEMEIAWEELQAYLGP